MTRLVKIAAVQLPNLRAAGGALPPRERNLREAERWLEDAGRQGADIACLAEMLTTEGAPLAADNLRQLIEPSPAALVERLGALARRHAMYLVAPCLGLFDGLPRNAALLIDRAGQLIGTYFKVHCTERERALGIVPGDGWPVFHLDFGVVGIHTCHDNSFPESARCLALNGAEVIFWPHVMSGWGDELMEVLMTAPAIYNGVVHVPVCYGCPPGTAWMPGMMIGRSSIIRPDGTRAADAGRYPGLALAGIDLDAPRLAGSFTRDGDYVYAIDMHNDRRPDTYQAITQARSRQEPRPAGMRSDAEEGGKAH